MSHPTTPTTIWLTNSLENDQTYFSVLGRKAAIAAEKHMGLCDADVAQDYGRTWKRLAEVLARLAPGSIDPLGHQTLKFHIPDGKYRKQVFALSDTGLGRIDLFLPDITELAVERKLLTKPAPDAHVYGIVGNNAEIQLTVINSDDREHPAFCRPMLGWGRKAICISVDAIPNPIQLSIVERLCALAAEAWEGNVFLVGAVIRQAAP